MIYIKLHGKKFNILNSDTREGLHGLPGINGLYLIVCTHEIQGLSELLTNDLNTLYVNDTNALYINVSPRDIHGLNELNLNGLNEMPITFILVTYMV